MPKPLVCSSLDVGGGGYVMTAAISDAMRKETGITLRIVPIGTDIGRLSMVRLGRAHYTVLGMAIYMSQEGVFDFAAQDWGPQPIRMVVPNWAKSGMLYATAKDANITTWADAKGKRFAWVHGYPAVNMVGAACLAFGGLTWDDVEKVEFPSFGTAGRGVIEGKVDASCAASYSSWVYELEASPRGLYYPPMPHAEKEAWERLLKVAPYYAPVMCTDGCQLSEEKPWEGGSYPNSNVTVYADASPELAYNIAKLYHELYPVYSKAPAAGITGYALDTIKKHFSWAIPFHEGAVRYYKEIGAWTAENDKNNQLMLKRQSVLEEAWEKALAQAADEKVKAKEYPQFWMGMRAEALEKAGFPVVYYPED